MGKLRQTALILGEGPTEFFYFKSLCDVFKRLTIKPDYPKHTNIKELDAKIAEGVAMGYSHIFCIIDMDTKDKDPERSQYQKLKAKYAKPINKPKKGIYCEVEFFETHRCTELFFLYYFRYTSRPYNDQEPLLKNLNQCVEYRKTIEFFIKTKGFMVTLSAMVVVLKMLWLMPIGQWMRSKRKVEIILTPSWGG